jgi:Uma2 family endonuclease
MADNTKQARWITVLYDNLSALYRDRADVFVAADNLWYPVEGNREIRNAPDVYVVFGRPKGDRSSYVQCEEGDVPLTVVFEILSPSNTPQEMVAKFLFYEEHGVEEYYVYDPDANTLEVATRGTAALVHRHPEHGFVSPRLGIRFDLRSGPEMVVYHPNGERFLTFEELMEERDQTRRRLARVLELSRRARRGLASPEEIAELDRLEAEQDAT